MIRIILAFIGIAFCVLSSLTAPAHAASVLASSGDISPGSMAAGIAGDDQGQAWAPTPYLKSPDLWNHPDAGSPLYGPSVVPVQDV